MADDNYDYYLRQSELLFPIRGGSGEPDPAEGMGELRKGWETGKQQVQALGYGLVGLAGDAVDSESIRDYGIEGYERNLEEAAQFQGNVTSYQDIHSVGDLADYALFGVGTLAPTMLTALAGGGVGGIALKKGAQKAVTSMLSGTVKKRAAEAVAKDTTKRVTQEAAEKAVIESLAKSIGTGAGVMTATSGMEAGGIFGEIFEETGEYAWDKALISGIAAGSLDALPIMGAFRKLGVGKIAKEGVTNTITKNKVLKNALQLALFEGSTEAVQTVIEKGAIKWVNDNYEVFSDENRVEMVDAFLLGTMGGAVIGGPTALAEGIAAKRVEYGNRPSPVDAEQAEQAASEQTAAEGGDALDQARSGAQAAESAEASTDLIVPQAKSWEELVKYAGLEEINLEEENASRVEELTASEEDASYAQRDEQRDLEFDESQVDLDFQDAELRQLMERAQQIAEETEQTDIEKSTMGAEAPSSTAMADALVKSGAATVESVEYDNAMVAAGAISTQGLAGTHKVTQKGEKFTLEPVTEEVAAIDQGAHEASTSPQNDLLDPTDGQIEAGNYKKGHTTVQGFDITIENPEGSTRSGTNEDGTPWSNTMNHHYGYLKRTKGADGDQVDVFIGPNPESGTVFVVDQVNQKTGDFDEHKVMMGFNSRPQAVKAYMSNYEAGWKMGKVNPMPVADFKEWLNTEDTTQAVETVSEDDFDALVERQQRKTGRKPTVRWSKSNAPVAFSKTPEGQLADLQAERDTLVEMGGETTVEPNEAHQTAQKNATLPISQGGLGLTTSNTSMDRAKAMGFDTDTTLYHGTNRDFSEFEVDALPVYDNGQQVLGVFLTPSAGMADRYTEGNDPQLTETKGGNIIPVYVKIKNSKVEGYGVISQLEEEYEYHEVQDYKDNLVLEGYDSIVFKETIDEIVVFNPENIRSVNAAFDPIQTDSLNVMFSKERITKLDDRIKSITTRMDRTKARDQEATERASMTKQAKVEKMVARVQTVMARGASINVIADMNSIPEEVRADVEGHEALNPGDVVRGFWHEGTNTSYLIAENLNTNNEIIATVLHEAVAHDGVRSLLGNQFDRVMMDIFEDKKAMPLIHEIAVNGGFDTSTVEGKLAVADEYVAHIAQDGNINPSLLKRVIATVREFLRSIGVKAGWSDADIRALLSKSLIKLNAKPLSAITITDELIIEGTNETVQVSDPADRVLRRLDRRIQTLQELSGCLAL